MPEPIVMSMAALTATEGLKTTAAVKAATESLLTSQGALEVSGLTSKSIEGFSSSMLKQMGMGLEDFRKAIFNDKMSEILSIKVEYQVGRIGNSEILKRNLETQPAVGDSDAASPVMDRDRGPIFKSLGSHRKHIISNYDVEGLGKGLTKWLQLLIDAEGVCIPK